MIAPLKRGSAGVAVRDLQSNLVRLGHPILIDGKFGAVTEGAVRSFQSVYGLVVDGMAGPQTQTALHRALEPVKPGRPEPDKSAMLEGVSGAAVTPENIASPPPNVARLTLLATARNVDEIIVHCTATPEGRDYTVADIRAWHKARGFSDIGYHYVVYRDGRVMLGRPVGQVGAHCADAGKNQGTIGISYVGGVAANGTTAKDTRTAAQRSSLLWLVQALAARHPVRRVTGHNRYARKACPSFDVALDPLSRISA